MSDNTKAEPNLTPLLDVVFQLITFFMLVINFSDANYDNRIKLPIAGSARPLDDPSKAAEDRLVLNVDTKGNLIFNGKTLSGTAAIEQIKFEAQLIKLNQKSLSAAAKAKADEDGLPTRVVIRADRDTPFEPIYDLIRACNTNGFRKFDLKAMTGAP